MTSHDYVRTLYQVFLGREVDNSGLHHWVNFIETGGDAIGVLDGIVNSEEYRSRSGQEKIEYESGMVSTLVSSSSAS